MDNSIPKITGAAKQAVKQTTHTLARGAFDQTLETLKTARTQVGLPVEKPSAQSSSLPSTVRTLQSHGPDSLNPEEIARREAELLAKWRQRLREIQEEELQTRRQRQEQYQVWKQAQEEAMRPSAAAQPEPLAVPAGKPKKGFLAGAKAAIQQKLSAPETGRSAKH